jgi:HAD superfamily hydrolase (TIGR01662 family)
LIRGIIFDLGNTLIHFTGDWNRVLEQSWQSLADFLVQKGYAIERDDFVDAFRKLFESRYYARAYDHVEQPTSDLFRQVMEKFGYDHLETSEIEEAVYHFYILSEKQWTPRESVNEVLDGLRTQGYRMALISNAGDTPNVQRLLEKASLTDYFEPTLVSATEGIRKPHVGLYQKIVAAWHFSPDQIVMIGDSLMEDILGAQRSGIHQIWMREHVNTPENNETSRQIRPEAIADTFQEIPRLIRQIAGEKELD